MPHDPPVDDVVLTTITLEYEYAWLANYKSRTDPSTCLTAWDIIIGAMFVQ